MQNIYEIEGNSDDGPLQFKVYADNIIGGIGEALEIYSLFPLNIESIKLIGERKNEHKINS